MLRPAQSGEIEWAARAELVRKSGEELVVDVLPSNLDSDAQFSVGHISLGYIRELRRFGSATLGLGLRGTANVVPSDLEAAYGSRTPLGALVFLRVRPAHAARSASAAPMHHEP